MADLIIRNALTRNTGTDLVDIAISGDKVTAIQSKIAERRSH